MTGLRHSRRSFLRQGAAGAGTLAAALAGCAGALRTNPNERYLKTPASARPGQVVLGMHARRDWRGACEQAVSAVSDLRWLNRGDSVFVKVSCNSDQIHPAVTAPGAVEAMVGLLRDRGAGRIYVGDQAGVEHVRLTPSGRVGATTRLMRKNGLLRAVERSGAELSCFDDQGWGSYFAPKLDFSHSWEQGLQLAGMIHKVDHIVSLPRLGTHALAGYTCGIKNAVGWLRDDSRRVLHQRASTFFEKMAEINNAPPLRDKLRLTLTLGDAAMLDIGPDFGGEYDFDGCVALASSNLVDHDALAAALLPWLDDQHLSFYDIYSPYPAHADFWNRALVKRTWGPEAMDRYQPLQTFATRRALQYDSCLSHLGQLQGYRPSQIRVKRQGGHFPRGLMAHLRTAGGGIFKVT